MAFSTLYAKYWRVLKTRRAVSLVYCITPKITRWNSTVCRRPLCLRPLWRWTLTFWSENLISTSTQVHMWSNFGEIGSNSYEDIVLTRFFGSLPAVTLAFDILTQKSNQQIYEPKYICDQNGWNSLNWFLRYGVHKVLGRPTDSQTHSRTDTPEYRMPPSPKVFSVGVIKINKPRQKLRFTWIV